MVVVFSPKVQHPECGYVFSWILYSELAPALLSFGLVFCWTYYLAKLKQAVDGLTQQLNWLVPPAAPVVENVTPIPSVVVASKFLPLTMLVVLQLGYSPPLPARVIAKWFFIRSSGTLAAELGWNGLTLHSAFYWGLSDRVRDMLVSGTRPKDRNELINRGIAIANYQRERRWERVIHSLGRLHVFVFLPLVLRLLHALLWVCRRRNPCSWVMLG